METVYEINLRLCERKKETIIEISLSPSYADIIIRKVDNIMESKNAQTQERIEKIAEDAFKVEK